MVLVRYMGPARVLLFPNILNPVRVCPSFLRQWFDGMHEGHGRETHADGSSFEGEFGNSKWIKGKYTTKDGRFEYVGSWKDGMRHGTGTCAISGKVRRSAVCLSSSVLEFTSLLLQSFLLARLENPTRCVSLSLFSTSTWAPLWRTPARAGGPAATQTATSTRGSGRCAGIVGGILPSRV